MEKIWFHLTFWGHTHVTLQGFPSIVLYVIREGILHQQPDDISFRLPEDVPLEFPEDVPMECLVIFPGNVMWRRGKPLNKFMRMLHIVLQVLYVMPRENLHWHPEDIHRITYEDIHVWRFKDVFMKCPKDVRM